MSLSPIDFIGIGERTLLGFSYFVEHGIREVYYC